MNAERYAAVEPNRFTTQDWDRLGHHITIAIHDKGLVRYELTEQLAKRSGVSFANIAGYMDSLERGKIFVRTVGLGDAPMPNGFIIPLQAYSILPHVEAVLGWDRMRTVEILLDSGAPVPPLPERDAALAEDMWAGMEKAEPEPEGPEQAAPAVRQPFLVESIPRQRGGSVLGRRIDESIDPALFEHPVKVETITAEQAAEDLAAIGRAKLISRLTELSTNYVTALDALAGFRPEIPVNAVIEARAHVSKAFGAAIQAVATKHLHEKE